MTADTPAVQWVWEVLDTFSLEDKCRCLEFFTGCSKVPLDGFMPPLCICGTESGTEALPRAHTCFNQLILPMYESKEQLRNKLGYAVRNSSGFQFA